MRKTLALLLTVLLLCAPAAVLAEDAITVAITFDGEYYEFEDYGFQIAVPSGWVVEDEEDEVFFAYDEETGYCMEIMMIDAGGAALEDIAAEIAAQEGYTIMPAALNGFVFVFFEAAEEEVFGAFANNPDDSVCFWFMFWPLGDAEFGDLALQILATIENT